MIEDVVYMVDVVTRTIKAVRRDEAERLMRERAEQRKASNGCPPDLQPAQRRDDAQGAAAGSSAGPSTAAAVAAAATAPSPLSVHTGAGPSRPITAHVASTSACRPSSARPAFSLGSRAAFVSTARPVLPAHTPAASPRDAPAPVDPTPLDSVTYLPPLVHSPANSGPSVPPQEAAQGEAPSKQVQAGSGAPGREQEAFSHENPKPCWPFCAYGQRLVPLEYHRGYPRLQQ